MKDGPRHRLHDLENHHSRELEMTTNASAKYIGIIALWLVLVLGWAQASHAGIIVCGKGYSNGVATTGRFDGSGSGTGLTLNLTVNGDGAIVSSSVAAAGRGYAVGDAGAVNGGNPVVGYQVDAVSNNDPNVLNGAVLRFHLIPLQLDLRNTSPALPDENPDSKFQQRVDAFNQFA